MAHPRMYDDANPALKRLREICLALPAVYEKEAWGECTFRVTGGSMFAMSDTNHHGSNHTAVWVKATSLVQEILVHADGKRFFVPPYVGPKGWVGVRLDYKVDWQELRGILEDAHRMSAPKRLRARLPPAVDQTATSFRSVKTRRAGTASKRKPAAAAKSSRRTTRSP